MTVSEHARRPLSGWGALVTGGSRGIGAAIARRLADDGAAVALTYHSRCRAADAVVEHIRARDGAAQALQLDLGRPEAFPSVFDAAQAFFTSAGARGLGVLVANAAIASHRTLADLTVEEWDRVMAVNARGVLLAVQHAAARMLDGGRIVSSAIRNVEARRRLPRRCCPVSRSPCASVASCVTRSRNVARGPVDAPSAVMAPARVDRRARRHAARSVSTGPGNDVAVIARDPVRPRRPHG